MKLLLDTHAILWWLLGDVKLSVEARKAIGAPEARVLVSSVSAMEVGTKYHIGKLPQAAAIAGLMAARIAEHGFEPLGLTIAHGDLAGMLDIPHRDPFDRLLIAQAQIEDAMLVSNETLFDTFGVRRLW
ncbi:type II toxin-antitoxin system VapC family toxin [Sphingomonas bacterium]|uniref:type II toxin-antitoxin system VapC family toxin n=1 Tax=Sphingomonas bacterium TaxID=1895847 RepID=UPI00157767B0|nr:type II toxin-antitoxin system VapC family toxin [Sphingomonas bacterium]